MAKRRADGVTAQRGLQTRSQNSERRSINGRASSKAASSAPTLYPLMPVSAMPWTKSRWPKKKTTSTGISTMSETAIM
jgi:hypothetical protein